LSQTVASASGTPGIDGSWWNGHLEITHLEVDPSPTFLPFQPYAAVHMQGIQYIGYGTLAGAAQTEAINNRFPPGVNPLRHFETTWSITSPQHIPDYSLPSSDPAYGLNPDYTYIDAFFTAWSATISGLNGIIPMTDTSPFFGVAWRLDEGDNGVLGTASAYTSAAILPTQGVIRAGSPDHLITHGIQLVMKDMGMS